MSKNLTYLFAKNCSCSIAIVRKVLKTYRVVNLLQKPSVNPMTYTYVLVPLPIYFWVNGNLRVKKILHEG